MTDTDTPTETTTRRPLPITRADFLTLDDLRHRLGLSPNGIRETVVRHGFPEPFAVVWRCELWRTIDVDAWQLEQLRKGWVYTPLAGTPRRG